MTPGGCLHDDLQQTLDAGWYDGAFAGVYRCQRCGEHYWMVVQAYDAHTLQRLFTWSAISRSTAVALGQLAHLAHLDARSVRPLLSDARVDFTSIGRHERERRVVSFASYELDDVVVPYRHIAESILIAPDAVRRHLEHRGVAFVDPDAR